MNGLSIIGIIVGGLVALFVYAIGTALTRFQNEDLIWALVALLVWGAIAFSGRFSDRL